ncbi:ATP-binding protein [Agromyces sp. NPDC058484]|uniref:ATP-binding protein n=1 Tax=Agromyces sp. NPDC058484 TaxID=3346524 RepID=UPI0036564855
MLIGRDAERRILGESVGRAVGGIGAALVVRGEPGIGKSALLRDLLERRTDVRALVTVGVESERPLAFAALHRLLLPLFDGIDGLPVAQAGALRRAFGLVASSDSPEDRFLTYLAALSLLTDAAGRSPIVCVIDDAHWLDDPSADALRFIARRIEVSAIAMVFAARDRDVRRFDAPDLPELTLTGLPPEEADRLIVETAGSSIDAEVRRVIAARTLGNPLALVELPSALSPSQASGVEDLPEHLVTEHVQEVFSGRLRPLTADARRSLLVAALDGSASLDIVRAAANSLGLGDDAFAAVEQSGLIEISGREVRMRHPLVRAVVLSHFQAPEHGMAHLALAGALERHHDPDRAVWHRAAAAAPPDDEVAESLEQAAQRFSSRGGHEAASSAYEHAARLSSSGERAGARLALAAGAAWAAADPQRTRLLAQRARATTTDAGALADLDRLRAFVEMNFGSPRLAHGILAGAAEEASHAGDPSRARQLSMVASALATFGADSGAPVQVDTPAAASEPVADAERSASLLLCGLHDLAGGRLEEAVPALREAITLAEHADAPDLVTNVGIATLQLGDDEAAIAWHARQLDAARAQASPLGVIHALTRRAIAQLFTGDWRELEMACAESLDLARVTGHANQRAFPLSLMLVADAYRGGVDIENRATGIEQLLKDHPSGVLEVITRDALAWARGIDRLGVAPETALQHLTGITTTIMRRAAALDTADAAVRSGAVDQVRQIAVDLHRFAEVTGNAWASDAAVYVSASIAAPGERDEPLGPHAARPAGTRRLIRGRVLLAYGEHLRRTRRRVQARVPLRQAHAIFDALGVTAFRDRAADELRASGESVRRGEADASAPAAGALTAQELHVARAVREGMPNREVAARLFLSPRTVEFHLRNIFTKLGITSRSELSRFDLGATD